MGDDNQGIDNKMSLENDANLANYSELRAHVDLSKKILEAEQADSDAYKESMNDLSMYYERLVQLKTMRIQTLEELNDEGKTAHKATTKIAIANKRAFVWLLRTAYVCLLIVGLGMWPSVGYNVYDYLHPYATWDRIGGLVIVIMWMNRGWIANTKLKKD